MTREEIDKIIAEAEHEMKGFNRTSKVVSEKLINALKQVKNIAYEPVLATVLDDPNTVKLCKPNYLAKDGSIKEAERFIDQKNEQIIYYCHKDD